MGKPRNNFSKKDTKMTTQSTEQGGAGAPVQEQQPAQTQAPQEQGAAVENAGAEQGTTAAATDTAATSADAPQGDNAEAGTDTAAADAAAAQSAAEDEKAEAEAPASVDVGQVLRAKTAFEIKNDEIRANGSTLLKQVLTTLETYVSVMGVTNTVVSSDVINQQQSALWRAIKFVLGSSEDFSAGMDLLISFVRTYRDGAFLDRMVYRGFEHTRLSAEQSKAFQQLLAVLTTASDLKDVRRVSRTIDLQMAMGSQVFADDSRQRVIGYFN